MRILFVLENHYPNIGGVETLFKTLTESLVKEGIEVTVLTNRFSQELLDKEVLNGVSIVRVPYRNRYLFTLLGCFSAIRYARTHDIIHTTSYNAGIPAYIAGLVTRKKVIITFHEVWNKLWFSLPYMSKPVLGLHYLFEKLLVNLSFSKFIAVSTATSDSLEKAGVPTNKIALIHNGIDYKILDRVRDKFDQAVVEKVKKSKPFTFLYFGRLGISKGLDLLLPAVALLKNETDDFKLDLIIPTSPESFHKRIKSIISDLEIEDYVDIHSDLLQSILLEKILKSDVVVIPSYSEGFCFTAVESMALGKPIISSGKGALKEVISGQYLEMREHTSQELSKQMKLAIDGKWDSKPVVKYELQDSIDKYIQLYKSIDGK